VVEALRVSGVGLEVPGRREGRCEGIS
jgi:hypothetical protein